MSDEAHMEAAMRHADQAALLPWHAPLPDEALMAKEEAELSVDEMRAEMQEVLMVYLFADGDPRRWENVALRALAVMRYFTRGLLCGRVFDEVPALQARASVRQSFSFDVLQRLTESPGREGILSKLMNYFFPDSGEGWLMEGCQRVYLIARNYQPQLVTMDGQEMCYEQLARVFEGDELATKKARDRARSRWSARAQKLIRLPVERAGGTIHMQFGKSATVRAKYAEKARGNGNRRRNGGGG